MASDDIFDIPEKVSVVIGGRGGIGKHLASGLAEYGSKVIIASRKLPELKETAEEIRTRTNGEVKAFKVDVTDPESTAELREEILSEYGKIDVLVNSQGANLKNPATEFPVKDWDLLYDVNVKGTMISCRELGKAMIEEEKGKVINMSSVRGVRATKWEGNIGYSSTKGAVDMFTRQLASEWAPYNINVNAIAPSLVNTGFSSTQKDPEKLKKYTDNIPLDRIGEPEDVIGTCIFLASSASDYITGQILYVDGGLTAIG